MQWFVVRSVDLFRLNGFESYYKFKREKWLTCALSGVTSNIIHSPISQLSWRHQWNFRPVNFTPNRYEKFFTIAQPTRKKDKGLLESLLRSLWMVWTLDSCHSLNTCSSHHPRDSDFVSLVKTALGSLPHPHTNSPNWSLYISLKNVLREFDKRSKHFLLSDHFVNSHNLISWQYMSIVMRKLMLVTVGT